MENIARVKMKTTLKTGRTSASRLYEEGTELRPPFPRIIKEEFARHPHYFQVLEYKKAEPEKQKDEKSSKPRAKLNV
jgi:hypothetical protein